MHMRQEWLYSVGDRRKHFYLLDGTLIRAVACMGCVPDPAALRLGSFIYGVDDEGRCNGCMRKAPGLLYKYMLDDLCGRATIRADTKEEA